MEPNGTWQGRSMSRHRHTPGDNAMLANTYIDVVEGKRSEAAATRYLCATYPHRPEASTVGTYLSAAMHAYEELKAGTDNNDRRWKYSRELFKQMRQAMKERGHLG